MSKRMRAEEEEEVDDVDEDDVFDTTSTKLLVDNKLEFSLTRPNGTVDTTSSTTGSVGQATTATTPTTTTSCPYLDTIQRSLLDFDLEPTCSVTLVTGNHIYMCLVCGCIFRGRSIHSPAYTHAVSESHYVFVHLPSSAAAAATAPGSNNSIFESPTFHIIPNDGTEHSKLSPTDLTTLQDIKNAICPLYTTDDINKLDERKEVLITDSSTTMTTSTSSTTATSTGKQQQQQQQQQSLIAQPAVISRDLFGRKYIPGFVGLSNFNKTDCINSIVHALAHVRPIRNYFLSNNITTTMPSTSSSSTITTGTMNNYAYTVTKAFGTIVRQLWSPYRYKSHIDPHALVNAITTASNKRYQIGVQCEAGELLTWLLHQIHIATSTTKTVIVNKKNKKDSSNNNNNNKSKNKTKQKIITTSIVEQTFQGKVRVTTKQPKRKVKTKKNLNNDNNNRIEDDREGSDAEQDIDNAYQRGTYEHNHNHNYNNGNNNLNENDVENIKTKKGTGNEVEEVVTTTNFLQLTLELPEKPLFRDEDGGLVIPQEPLVNVLKKLDGVTFTDALAGTNVPIKKRYELIELPNYLILQLGRFTKKRNGSTSTTTNRTSQREKNPSIVVFPVKNLDLTQYVVGSGKHPNDTDHVKQQKQQHTIPTPDEVRQMSISELKQLLKIHGRDDVVKSVFEKEHLIEIVLDFIVTTLPNLLQYKYDLIANIIHSNPIDVGREGYVSDPLQDGNYKVQVQHYGTNQWYEIQDLHIAEILPQQIGISESYILLFERKR